MDERRPLDYYITCIFWGSGISDNARARGISESMRATNHDVADVGEATALYDIEGEVTPKRRMRVL